MTHNKSTSSRALLLLSVSITFIVSISCEQYDDPLVDDWIDGGLDDRAAAKKSGYSVTQKTVCGNEWGPTGWYRTASYDKAGTQDSEGDLCYSTNTNYGTQIWINPATGCKNDKVIICGPHVISGSWKVTRSDIDADGCDNLQSDEITRVNNSSSCSNQDSYPACGDMYRRCYFDWDGDGFHSKTECRYTCNGKWMEDTDGLEHCKSNPDMQEGIQYYIDRDNDGYGSKVLGKDEWCSLEAPSGYSANNTDCNDRARRVHRFYEYFIDEDGDGYGSNRTEDICAHSADSRSEDGYSPNNLDMDDKDEFIGEKERSTNCRHDYDNVNNYNYEKPGDIAEYIGEANSGGWFTQIFNNTTGKYDPSFEEACEWRCKQPRNSLFSLQLRTYRWNDKCVPIGMKLTMSKYEVHTNRPGNDYKQFATSRSGGAARCRDACEDENHKCISWTFYNGTCYLKNRWGQPTQSFGTISGVTMIDNGINYKDMEHRTDRPGNNYKSFSTSEVAMGCQHQCMIEDRCKSWTHVSQNDGTYMCHLKPSVKNKVGNAYCTSGVK